MSSSDDRTVDQADNQELRVNNTDLLETERGTRRIKLGRQPFKAQKTPIKEKISLGAFEKDQGSPDKRERSTAAKSNGPRLQDAQKATKSENKRIYVEIGIQKKLEIKVRERGLTVAWLHNKLFERLSKIDEYLIQGKNQEK